MSDTRQLDMQQMRRAGYSDTEIGARFGLSRQRVHQLLGATLHDRRGGARLTHATPPAVPPRGSAADRALPGVLTGWRARHGLTQREAAAILHLSSVTTYSKWERGLGCGLAALVIDFIRLWEQNKAAAPLSLQAGKLW